MEVRKQKMVALFSLMAVCCGTWADNVITITYQGNKASVSKVVKSDSVNVKTDGAKVVVENFASAQKHVFRLVGASDDAQFVLKTNTKDKIELQNVKIQSKEGAPINIKGGKKVEICALKGTDNSLSIAACNDTANNKPAVIYSKGKLEFTGTGKLAVLASGNGCKGISAKNDIIINDLTLDVKTIGDNLGPDTTHVMGFGGPGGPMGMPMGGPGEHRGHGGPGGHMGGGMPGPPPNFNFDDLPDSIKQKIEEMRKKFENGEFPPFGGFGGAQGGNPFGGPEGHDAHGFGGPGFGGPGFGGPGGFMGKQKFLGTCKGIKSTDVVTVNSGNVTVYTTSRGAEGIEGKKGVVINGGTVSVNSMDDAINANAQIYFNGGKITAISRTNDAVDANVEGGFDFGSFFGGDNGNKKKLDPAIIIKGAEVYAYSQVGPPEEGLDCDFAPIEVANGKVFSIGAGMGDMPSVPTEETAKQPTALLIGLNLTEGKEVKVKDAKGRVVMSVVAPFNFRNSSSIITCPEMKKGETYSVETEGYSKSFVMEKQFMVVR